MTRKMVCTITSQCVMELARPWLPALVASVVSLYRLGDPVYGFLQRPLRLVGLSLVLQASISGQGAGSLLDASLRLIDVPLGHSPSWFELLPGTPPRFARPLSSHHDQCAHGQIDDGCSDGPPPAAQPAGGVTTTLEAPFFVRSADYSPSSGGRIEQRQHHTDDAGDDEDQADRWPRHARHVECDGVADDRADGDEENRCSEGHS